MATSVRAANMSRTYAFSVSMSMRKSGMLPTQGRPVLSHGPSMSALSVVFRSCSARACMCSSSTGPRRCSFRTSSRRGGTPSGLLSVREGMSK